MSVINTTEKCSSEILEKDILTDSDLNFMEKTKNFKTIQDWFSVLKRKSSSAQVKKINRLKPYSKSKKNLINKALSQVKEVRYPSNKKRIEYNEEQIPFRIKKEIENFEFLCFESKKEYLIKYSNLFKLSQIRDLIKIDLSLFKYCDFSNVTYNEFYNYVSDKFFADVNFILNFKFKNYLSRYISDLNNINRFFSQSPYRLNSVVLNKFQYEIEHSGFLKYSDLEDSALEILFNHEKNNYINYCSKSFKYIFDLILNDKIILTKKKVLVTNQIDYLKEPDSFITDCKNRNLIPYPLLENQLHIYGKSDYARDLLKCVSSIDELGTIMTYLETDLFSFDELIEIKKHYKSVYEFKFNIMGFEEYIFINGKMDLINLKEIKELKTAF